MKKNIRIILLCSLSITSCTGMNFSALDNPFISPDQAKKNTDILIKARAKSAETPSPTPYNQYNNPNLVNNNNLNQLNAVRAVEIRINEPTNKTSPTWYQVPVDRINTQKKLVALQNTIITEAKASVVLNDGTRSSNIKWSSSDNSLITVNPDSGQISVGNTLGKATITAISVVDSSKKDILEIEIVDKGNFTLSENSKVNNVTVSLANPNGGNATTRWVNNGNQILSEVGATVQVFATAFLQDGTKNSKVQWETADDKIAIVTPEGQIKAVGIGRTSIVARYILNPTYKGIIDIEVVDNIPTSRFPIDPTKVTPVPTNIPTPVPTQTPEPIPSKSVEPSAPPVEIKANPLVLVEGNDTIKAFFITKYEITQKDWLNVVPADPSIKTGDNLPVSNISWFNAITYCNERSKKEALPIAYDVKTGNLLDETGTVTTDTSLVKGYRLPTAEEWEYAAKGGISTFNFTFSGNNDYSKVAWNASNSGAEIKEVGTKQANELGLFDMSGNLYEWVNNASADKSKRAIKGGSYRTGETQLTTAFEIDPKLAFVNQYGYLGFRIVKTK